MLPLLNSNWIAITFSDFISSIAPLNAFNSYPSKSNLIKHVFLIFLCFIERLSILSTSQSNDLISLLD